VIDPLFNSMAEIFSRQQTVGIRPSHDREKPGKKASRLRFYVD
jgi:hypothetical protein